MNSLIKLQLSPADIQVMAALLGYESVFGLKDEDVISKGAEAKERIHQCIHDFEEKSLIHYELDGTLYIDSNVKSSIECMCEADTIGVISGNLADGKKNNCYIMVKDRKTIYVEPEIKEYKLIVTDSFLREKVFPIQFSELASFVIDKTIPMKKVERIREKIDSFDLAGAKEIIRTYVEEDFAIRMIERILSGKPSFMSAQVYKKGKSFYRLAGNLLLFATEGQFVKVAINEERDVKFTTMKPEDAVDWLVVQMGFYKK